MSNGVQKGLRWNSQVKGNSYTESGIFVIGVVRNGDKSVKGGWNWCKNVSGVQCERK